MSIKVGSPQSLTVFEGYLRTRVSPGTVKVYMYALSCFFDQLNGHTANAKTAQQYVDLLAKTKSPSTVSLRAHAIMRWFRWSGIPIELDCPTVRIGEPDYLNMQQLEKLLAGCKDALEKVLITVLFDTAVRVSELLNIELDDIDWSNGLISVVRKGGRREEVNISEKALGALDEWLESRVSTSKKVFMGLTYWDAWNTIKNVGKRAKIKVHPHIFRHSRAVQMLMSGATLHDVQLHLGHASITTTANIYGRFKALDIKKRVPSW